jgi:glycine hydroxymethyltransferase
VTLNRNTLPNDPNGPWYTSGLRIGTPAVTTLGMGASEMKEIASIIKLVLQNTAPSMTKTGESSKAQYQISAGVKDEAVQRTRNLLDRYPVYPQLDLGMLQRYFPCA